MTCNIKAASVTSGIGKATAFSLIRLRGYRQRADQIYERFEPLKPEDIARVISFAISQPAHVNINDIAIMPTA